MGFRFTDSQRLAIEERGTSLLVSAAAGSGKTRVLTERLMRYVTDPDEPRDIDSFLIITYTRAAAAELRSRIIGELGTLAAEQPLNARLRRQQNLCYRAQIGTIHSFCTDVLRENCHYLGISPSFLVMDEDRARTMQQSVLERLLDARYESIGSDSGFRLLADTVGAGRDDRRLAEIVLNLYGKLRSHPYPEDWATQQIRAMELDGVSDAGESIWGRELLSSVSASVRFWSEKLDRAVQDIYSADEKIKKAYGESFQVTAEALRDFARALGGRWDEAGERLPIPFPRLSSLRNYDNLELSGRLKTTRDGCKKAAEGWEKALGDSSEALIADMRAMAPASRALLELAMDFDRAFSAEKRRQNYLDFSDLEHFAARLLVDKATGAPTWIAAELSRRYTEIMVDEYQDVNAVQEMIFSAVSKSGNNLFMVGDVKQSIYRFRLADLAIFLEKYRRYENIDSKKPGKGRRILLRENFRSRRCILDAANHVFSNIMSQALGEIDYDESAALKFGAIGYPDGSDIPVELDIIDPCSVDDEETPEKAEQEAKFVAGKINELISSGASVYENGEPRQCTYGDFAILMRSPSGNGGVFHRVLTEAGIPVQSKQGGGFFASLEVAVTVNMLSIIDNPHSDVPLISVLRSPAFAFEPNELSAIRACNRDSDYYGALCSAAQGGDEKCAAFLSLLERLRAAAPDMGVGELIWRIYNETDLFALCSAMSGADARRSNLMHLFEYARKFESGGGHGVFRFVSWLQRLAQRGEEPAVGGDGDAVKIMSIHKSKGLEFPFVFLCDLSHRFNKKDMTAAVLMHTELGLGPKMTDTIRGIEYPTLARRAIESRMLTETLSEEMRVLYVGMTRARERLFMTCTWKNAAEGMEKLRPNLTSPIAPELLRSAPSFCRWIASSAMLDGGDVIRINVIGGSSGEKNESSSAPVEEADYGEAYALLRSRLSYIYPYASAADLPSKLTATGIKGRFDDAERMSDSGELMPEPISFHFRRPQLGTPQKLDAAERGTATHSLLQYMDFGKAADENSVRSELNRLTRSGHLTPEQAQAVDIHAVIRFGTSPLCRRILSADQVRREFRFTLLVNAKDYFDVCTEDAMLMQGVVDCFIVEKGEITVIDYKTDRISPEEMPARAVHYSSQLRAYARALERICTMPVTGCLLYFLSIGQCCPVDIKRLP